MISGLRRRLDRLEGNNGKGCPACAERQTVFVEDGEPDPDPPRCERCGGPVPLLIVREEVVEARQGGEA
jgi:hypothetical protein